MKALKPVYLPMEARPVSEIPVGSEWQYEPKWDGFRCIVFHTEGGVFLQSKSGRPLARYFPDLVEVLGRATPAGVVLDGEIVIPVAGRLSFDELLMRVHPAASRVRMLAEKHPAMLVVFDLLQAERGRTLVAQPLARRRAALEEFFAKRKLSEFPAIRLSPASNDPRQAARWFKAAGGNLDGIIAKRADMPYRSGLRDGMQKVKHRRTADCVVGGFRYAAGKKVVGSLLLGLYDRDGSLNHVGFTSSFTREQRAAMTRIVEPLLGPSPFTGPGPGRPSRWNKREENDWEPLKAKLVVEVEYDHFTGGRFRHGTTFVRWRPDKRPAACTTDPIERGRGSVLKLLGTVGASRRAR